MHAPTAEQLLRPERHKSAVLNLLWEISEYALLSPLNGRERPELAELLFPDEGRAARVRRAWGRPASAAVRHGSRGLPRPLLAAVVACPLVRRL